MNVQEQLSQYLFTAVDFIGRSTETLQKTYQQMMENRQVSIEEGQRMYEDFMKNTEERRAEFEAQLGKILEKVAENLHLATLKNITELQEKIEKLEKRVVDLEGKP
jgi:polyhydroxyalkanoate synthesis regulator phasin